LLPVARDQNPSLALRKLGLSPNVIIKIKHGKQENIKLHSTENYAPCFPARPMIFLRGHPANSADHLPENPLQAILKKELPKVEELAKMSLHELEMRSFFGDGTSHT